MAKKQTLQERIDNGDVILCDKCGELANFTECRCPIDKWYCDECWMELVEKSKLERSN